MSTDLELRLPMIKTVSSPQSSDITYDERCTSEEDCHTPRSPQHRIPAVVSCPPAPRKRRRSAVCKRKLCELQFFEIVARDEVESLFTRINNEVNKRKRAI